MNPETFRGMAVSALVSAAVSFGMLHVAMPRAHAGSVESQLAAAPEAPAPARRALPPPAQGDLSDIHEAYSDGGYWDWMERQHAMP